MPTQEKEDKRKEEKETPTKPEQPGAAQAAAREKEAAGALAAEELVMSDNDGEEQIRLDRFNNKEGLEDTIRQLDEYISGLEAQVADIDGKLFDKAKFDAGWRRGERETLQTQQNQLKEKLAIGQKEVQEARERLTKWQSATRQPDIS